MCKGTGMLFCWHKDRGSKAGVGRERNTIDGALYLHVSFTPCDGDFGGNEFVDVVPDIDTFENSR